MVVGDGLQTAPVQFGFSIDELVIRQGVSQPKSSRY